MSFRSGGLMAPPSETQKERMGRGGGKEALPTTASRAVDGSPMVVEPSGSSPGRLTGPYTSSWTGRTAGSCSHCSLVPSRADADISNEGLVGKLCSWASANQISPELASCSRVVPLELVNCKPVN